MNTIENTKLGPGQVWTNRLGDQVTLTSADSGSKTPWVATNVNGFSYNVSAKGRCMSNGFPVLELDLITLAMTSAATDSADSNPLGLAVGQTWRTRNGRTGVIESGLGDSKRWPWAIAIGGMRWSLSHQGYNGSRQEPGADHDIVERLVDASFNDSVRKGLVEAAMPAVRQTSEVDKWFNYLKQKSDADGLPVYAAPIPGNPLEGIVADVKVSVGAWENVNIDMRPGTLVALNETHAIPFVEGYERLAAVLVRAHEQAATGKGKERHNLTGTVAFEDQPMTAINKMIGSLDGFIFQAHKKSHEALGLPNGRAQAELLGAINYLAGAIIALDTWAAKK